MKRKFTKSWKSSKQPRKQRKYQRNAPLNIKHRFLSVLLSDQLREKYQKRNIPVKKGDTVKILRGQFKKKSGKVTKVFLKKTRVHVEGMDLVKKDGSKVPYSIHPSNLMITELTLDDKKRQKVFTKK